jgi:hypothetical protein
MVTIKETANFMYTRESISVKLNAFHYELRIIKVPE